ncbi:hypothetical protein FIE12Z_10252 [Fusarium flagelliforme]|uniref:Uncharacterized protein n=1 Tax=Fusarium flagelliforme TaxID=2675880 RepID=A0A395MCF0_9HYPO|nr:hypothetical protein FIE12Z_10252 [Fusarium flagelliforme]
MVSAAASDTTMEPYEHFLTTSLCYAQDQVRTHPEHSGTWPKDPNAISLFDVLGLDLHKKPFRPIRESLYPEGKNGKEAKEALENKAVDWTEAKKILGNEDIPDQEVMEFLRTGVNQTALMEMPGPDINRLMDMTMRWMVHTVLSDEDKRLLYQARFLPRLKRGELQRFCDDIMEKSYSHDEL